MNQIAKILVISGVILIILGLALFLAYRFNIPFLGKLPGDIYIKRENFSFYFPITTCILISLILTLFFYLFKN
ncbi:MAG: DUF2905 domain-containing protein [Candidatus Omnitrophica bacterium]|nr:DUF2905 domain-containing protein [Candidatus Omnitrophota bacterium]MCF7909274.1 DUF2905 domain-containing protein [Candidatus Omnitrophota bacterium]